MCSLLAWVFWQRTLRTPLGFEDLRADVLADHSRHNLSEKYRKIWWEYEKVGYRIDRHRQNPSKSVILSHAMLSRTGAHQVTIGPREVLWGYSMLQPGRWWCHDGGETGLPGCSQPQPDPWVFRVRPHRVKSGPIWLVVNGLCGCNVLHWLNCPETIRPGLDNSWEQTTTICIV